MSLGANFTSCVHRDDHEVGANSKISLSLLEKEMAEKTNFPATSVLMLN